jgi:hypothetical protein
MAPLCVKSAAFPPVDGAPVLAAVKQTALDCGCGSALGQGVGKGLAGMAESVCLANAGFCAAAAMTIGVSVQPGARVFTRIFSAAFSIAATRVSPCTCFDAA